MNARKPMDLENCNPLEKFCGAEAPPAAKTMAMTSWLQHSSDAHNLLLGRTQILLASLLGLSYVD